MKNSKIVFPLLNGNLSGGNRIALQYASGLADLGYNIIILIPKYQSGIYFNISSNVVIREVCVAKIIHKHFKYLATIMAISKSISKDDLVFAVSWQSLLTSLFSFHPFSKKFLLIQHDNAIINRGRSFLKSFFNNILYRIIYRLPIHKFSVSIWLKEHLEKKYSVETVWVPNGTIMNQFYSLSPPSWSPPSETFDVLCLGRSADWKGLPDLYVACRILMKEGCNLRLIIVSHDSLDLPADIPIKIMRPKNDVEIGRIYRSCSVFAFSSWIEGFGLPPLEAMANGAPVVTTNCGGVNDFALNEFNCLMVEPRNPSLLANALLRVKNDKSLSRLIASNGLITARRFTMDRSIKLLEREMKKYILG
jgi:glycosyltransferase involved in cell wall biosynthesis